MTRVITMLTAGPSEDCAGASRTLVALISYFLLPCVLEVLHY